MSLKWLGSVLLLLLLAEPLSVPEATESRPPAPTTPAPPAKPEPSPLPEGVPPPPPGHVYWKTVEAKVTAYEPSDRCCGDSADGKTSIGDNAWIMDGVAVAPEAIPYRTRLWLPGAGWKEADDTGSAMRKSWRKGKIHLDLRMPYFGQARRWGVRHLTVHLYRAEDRK